MQRADVWAVGDAYEAYVGRWSRLVGREFIDWLALPPEAMARCRLRHRRIDADDSRMRRPRQRHRRRSVRRLYRPSARADARRSRQFPAGKAEALPLANASSTLLCPASSSISFRSRASLAEMRRSPAPGGTAAVYVWDYAGEMQLMRHFWDAAVALDPAAATARRRRAAFRSANRSRLQALFKDGGFDRSSAAASMCRRYSRTSTTTGRHFSVDRVRRRPIARRLPARSAPQLREKIRARLPVDRDGTIPLIARAWAIAASSPGSYRSA